MALEALLLALERQAAEAATDELEVARAEATRIDTEGTEHRAQRMTMGLDEHALALHAAAERIIAEVRRTERRRVLASRQQLLERIFARAQEILTTETSPSADGLGADVQQALRYLADVPTVIECAPSVAEELRTFLADSDRVTVRPDPALRLGFRARAADESMLIDYTPERRLAALRPRLAIELLRRVEDPA